ncbi:unnamed protein product [Arabis nemorensis]|uniref:Uncharacterized protein n=1 Tax=Arabis nemorensis TaxID=586526 RepID=A0A565C0V2_9BRAS|nr:unnamed protein product [Arabis nemorensis]
MTGGDKVPFLPNIKSAQVPVMREFTHPPQTVAMPSSSLMPTLSISKESPRINITMTKRPKWRSPQKKMRKRRIDKSYVHIL